MANSYRAQGTRVLDAMLSPRGYQQISVTSGAAVSLTVPEYTEFCIIVSETATLRWRDDGVNPTTSVGMPIVPNTFLLYSGNALTFRAIAESTTGLLNISYYG